jgi:hypothetical protein
MILWKLYLTQLEKINTAMPKKAVSLKYLNNDNQATWNHQLIPCSHQTVVWLPAPTLTQLWHISDMVPHFALAHTHSQQHAARLLQGAPFKFPLPPALPPPDLAAWHGHSDPDLPVNLQREACLTRPAPSHSTRPAQLQPEPVSLRRFPPDQLPHLAGPPHPPWGG